MEDTGSYEPLSVGDEPGGKVQLSEGQPRNLTHRRMAHEEQSPKEDTRMTAHGRSVTGVLASGG